MCGGSRTDNSSSAIYQQNRMIQQQHDENLAQQQSILDQQLGYELQRQAQISDAMAGVNSAFGNRAPIYQQLENATYDLNRDRLADDRAQNEQQLGFALARSGLSGGSVDVDKNADLLQRYNQGLVQARSHASDAAANARGRDEQLRASLLGMAGSGAIGGGQAYQMASQGLQSQAAAPSYLPGLSNIFQGLSDSIGMAARYAGLRQGGYGGEDEYNSVHVSSPGRSYGGNVT